MSYRVRVASVYLLGFFIDLVNMFIANVAYPEIGRRLGASVSQLAWISNGYILGLTLVIPLSGWLARRMGAKRLFMLSLLIFTIGTCGVGASTSVSQIVAWRWVFLASLPLAVMTFVLAGCWLKADTSQRSSESLDLVGLVSGCAALTLILLGLTYLGESERLNQGVLMLLIGILALAGYVRNALRKSNPLINLHLVKNRLLQTAMLIYQFIPGVFTGVSMITMLYLQNQLGMHASFVGALMLPWSLASFAAIGLTGKKFNLWGPRPLFITGCLAQAAGIGMLALTGHSADAIVCVLAFTLMGFGGSLCSSTAQSSAFIQIADPDLADASALWNINRQLSFCLGVTLISLIFNLIANTGLPIKHAYHLSFVIAACSAVIPVLCCFRIANQKVIFILNKEQK